MDSEQTTTTDGAVPAAAGPPNALGATGREAGRDAAAGPARPGVLAIRHGLTQWNADSRWQGWADVPLSAVGEEQAAHAAAAAHGLLHAHRPLRIVSSDLERAQRTARQFVAAFRLGDARTVADLRERDIGEWSGLTTDEIEARWPGWLDRWRGGELDRTPSGEFEDVLKARVSGALEALCAEAADDGAVIIAVTHGGVIRTLERLYGVDTRPVGNLAGRWFHAEDGGVVAGAPVELLSGVRGGGTSL